MDRRLTVFPCAGEWLGGTLDAAPGGTGLLIVSGGSEVRIGAHRGMALLAARLARAGVPVFRYDRRGIGDSSGTDPGFAAAGPDLRAAVTAFRAGQPQLRRLVALGNCDAAALLALEGRAAGLDAVILTNPWTGAEADALPPAAAIRARYRARLRDLLLCAASQSVREEAASLVGALADDGGGAAGRGIAFVELLVELLPAAVAAAPSSAEYFELLRSLIAPRERRLYLVARGLLGALCALIGEEARRVRLREDDAMVDMAQGAVLKTLIDVLHSLLELV